MRQYKQVRFIIMLLGALAWSVSAQTKPCFSNHIRESIKINQKMKEKYSLLTQGRSNRIYQELIVSEKLTFKIAKHFDRQAVPFQKKKMDLFCNEFVKMEVRENSPQKAPAIHFSKFDWVNHHQNIKSALQSKRPDEIRSASLKALLELKKQPDYYCFTRHMFESIYRLAFFLPQREEEAKAKNLPSPSKLFYQIMGLHNLSLTFTSHLDHLSAPIQEMGIPILCHELPELLKDLPEAELNPLTGI